MWKVNKFWFRRGVKNYDPLEIGVFSWLLTRACKGVPLEPCRYWKRIETRRSGRWTVRNRLPWSPAAIGSGLRLLHSTKRDHGIDLGALPLLEAD